jgi:hypothetical protein
MGAAFGCGQQSEKHLARWKTSDEHADVVVVQAENTGLMTLRFGWSTGRLHLEYTAGADHSWGRGHMGCKRGLLRPRLALGCGTGRRETDRCRPHRSDQ